MDFRFKNLLGILNVILKVRTIYYYIVIVPY